MICGGLRYKCLRNVFYFSCYIQTGENWYITMKWTSLQSLYRIAENAIEILGEMCSILAQSCSLRCRWRSYCESHILYSNNNNSLKQHIKSGYFDESLKMILLSRVFHIGFKFKIVMCVLAQPSNVICFWSENIFQAILLWTPTFRLNIIILLVTSFCTLFLSLSLSRIHSIVIVILAFSSIMFFFISVTVVVSVFCICPHLILSERTEQIKHTEWKVHYCFPFICSGYAEHPCFSSSLQDWFYHPFTLACLNLVRFYLAEAIQALSRSFLCVRVCIS